MPKLTPFIAVMALFMIASAQARDLDQDEALRLRQEGVIQPLQQLLQPVFDRYPGARMLEAELEQEDNVYVYEIELLTAAGEVREVDLDAVSGRLLKDEEDD
ncbi:PepSY domain-containing protein [Pseudomonas sp. MAP12]|uniref:PepSY domain-containing protein n=1 Tax=Geopseudomonas aromaticivorans TaxID=2849492 RepID=A0ABS6MSC7_9GAMM|nr:PepSY domain-containing protein [Pseudomonas aromaticivorans]MBV2131706.1 PepSY domain-containing protein [Pseudomonas aromaticivorans]